MVKKIKIVIFQRLFHSANFRNSFWMIGDQVFQMLISFIVGLLSVRYLGPSNYGVISYTASFVSFFTSVSALGMEGVVIKKLIEYPDEEGAYLGGCIILRVIASVISIISIEILIILLDPGDKLKLVLGLLQGFQLFWNSFMILDSYFQRYLQSKYVSIGKILASLVVAIYRIWLLISAKSVIWFAFSATISTMFVSITAWLFFARKSSCHIRISITKGWEVLTESYHFIISGIMVAIYSQMDRIMIGNMLGDEQVGYYTTANAISSMWIFIPIAIINSFRAMILELKNNGNEVLYRRRLEQLYSALIWMSMAFSAGISFFSKWIVLLLYGEAYLRAANVLKICIWYELFAVIGTARGIWILAEGKNRYVKYYLGIGAVVNVVLNFWLIPMFGINGAAFATLVTQMVTSILAPLFFKETRIHTRIVGESFVCRWYFKK